MKIYGKGSIVPLEKKSKYKCRKWRLYLSTECGRMSKLHEGKWTDAKKALEAFKNELSCQTPQSEQFGSYALSWLRYRENLGTLAPGTLANNKREVAAILRSSLSSVELSTVSARDCRDALIWIKQHPASGKKTLSNTTMAKIYVTLSAILSQAVDDGLLERSPMEKIKAPKPDTKEKDALTPAQLMRFVRDLDALPIDGRVMSLYFMALLGLRRAEACALYVRDVSADAVHVRRAIKERDGSIAEPKSPSSVRVLPMPPLLLAKVDKWLEERREHGLEDAETLCCNTLGGVLRPQLLQRWWTGDAAHIGMRDKIGYSGITLHQLRHSNLSMTARHLSPYDLQRYAGWSSIEPAKVYVHAEVDNLQRAIDEIYGGSCNFPATKAKGQRT